MIHGFKAKNFYSIGDTINVNFEAPDKVASKELYAKAPLGRNVTKIGFVGGQNASGKTNVLRVLAFLGYFIARPVGDQLDSIPFEPFATMTEENTEISVTFSYNEESIYEYSLVLNRSQIIMESLDKRYFKNEREATSNVFRREWDVKKACYEISVSDDLPVVKHMPFAKNLLENNKQVSFIPIFNVFEQDNMLGDIYRFWDRLMTNIMRYGSAETEWSLTRISNDVLMRSYSNLDLQRKIKKMLERYDIGFKEFRKNEINEVGQKKTVYGLSHKYATNEFDVPLSMESNGTKKIIILMWFVIQTLNCGSVAVMDELDAYLHPDIYDDILELFMSRNSNPYNAQLIFSAHNYSILAKLDKQQINLSERNEKGETEVWRLDEVNGVRTDENFYARYLAGVYGGKAKITNAEEVFNAKK